MDIRPRPNPDHSRCLVPEADSNPREGLGIAIMIVAVLAFVFGGTLLVGLIQGLI